jgi:hypothetical protein
VPKSATDASRLGIRMDSAQWKNGSVTIKVYLTAWFYPLASLQGSSTDLPDDVAVGSRRRRRTGNSNDPNTSSSAPFPGGGSGTDPAPPPPSPEQGLSKHRVLMKNVESERNNVGAITLVSKSVNIKLDKDTAYVLAGNPLPAN